MAATMTKVKRVGRKRKPFTGKPKTPSDKFAVRLGALVGDDAQRVASDVGVSYDAVLKWCRGDNIPDLDRWPALAKSLGLKDWRELLPPL